MLLFVLVPLLELAILIEVGSRIGALATIGLCLLTAAMGGILVRAQGRAVLRLLRRQLELGRLPVVESFHAICLLLAGVMLLTPGFLTDAMGFLLLLPPLRQRLYAILRRRLEVEVAGWPGPPHPRVIEGDYEEIDDEPPPGRGWGRR
jgi:UPF0716 protein FxsA